MRNVTPHADFAWLLRLRWVALAVEAWIVVSADWGHGPVPAGSLGAIGAVLLVTNLAGHLRARNPRPPRASLVAGLLAADVLALTGVLWLTGGASNPYTVFYLVFIALSVLTVPPAWAWALVALSVAGYASLFMGHGHHAHHHDMSSHLRGMWLAFALTAVALVWFVGRVNAALRARDAALAEAERAAAEADRLVSLGTLAAGAAHELASPLGTIAIAAKELRLSLADADADVLEDVALIGDEVRRCQRILERLATDAGQPAGEGVRTLTAPALMEGVLAELAEAHRVDVQLDRALSDRPLTVFERAWTEAVRGVVENALLADAGRVQVQVQGVADRVRVVVRDQGPGMSAEVLARATEPFYTTRPAGQGMGLGLFLARTLVERAGGGLHLQSELGAGTMVTLDFPEVSA